MAIYLKQYIMAYLEYLSPGTIDIMVPYGQWPLNYEAAFLSMDSYCFLEIGWITAVGLWMAAVTYNVNGLLSIIGLHTGVQYPDLAFGAIFVLAGVVFSTILQKLLSNKFLVWMGRMSFSVYVIQMIIICSYGCIVFSLLNQLFSYNIAAIVSIVSTIILVYLVAPYFYELFDLGGQRLSNALYRTSYNKASLMVQKTYNFCKSGKLLPAMYEIMKNPFTVHSSSVKGETKEGK